MRLAGKSRVVYIPLTKGISHMKIKTFRIDTNDPRGITAALRQALGDGPLPDFVALHGNADLDQDILRQTAQGTLPEGALHGATSCLGVMTQTGQQTAGAPGLGGFILHDPEGDYGTAMEPLAQAPEHAAARATRRALHLAGRQGELPDLIWLSATPGHEEQILQGIQQVVGQNVPIIGGTAADNDLTGNWTVFDRDRTGQDAVVVSVLFPSTPLSFAYQNGYAPTAASGTVTRADGRVLYEIDNRPAAEVYDEWSQGQVIPDALSDPAPILSASTLWPLGRPVADLGGIPYYLLAHPSVVRPDGALELFADVEPGEILTQMTGTVDGLTARAGRVAGLAREVGALDVDRIEGALMIYCGGCMLSVRDRMDDVVSGIAQELPKIPFLGVFTFGEQGNILEAGNRHGNLMISCILFTR